MPYTRELLDGGWTRSFLARAHPPTVTMPRIKVRMDGLPLPKLPILLSVFINQKCFRSLKAEAGPRWTTSLRERRVVVQLALARGSPEWAPQGRPREAKRTHSVYTNITISMFLCLLQALTSGTIPGFIDIVLNLDSSALAEDNLISQMHRQDKKLFFYGDDTWMRLFPGHFTEADGTTSFFVTDYTEVIDVKLPSRIRNIFFGFYRYRPMCVNTVLLSTSTSSVKIITGKSLWWDSNLRPLQF